MSGHHHAGQLADVVELSVRSEQSLVSDKHDV